jgi:hypothetical protein
VSYMIESCLKYGFLTTYKETLFLRRVDRYRFELSPPIKFSDTEPTVRQCFLFLSKLCAIDSLITDPTFYGEEVTRLLFRDASGLLNSQRRSAGRLPNFVGPAGAFPVTKSTTVVGTDQENFAVTIVEKMASRVFKVDVSGHICVLKYFTVEEEIS